MIIVCVLSALNSTGGGARTDVPDDANGTPCTHPPLPMEPKPLVFGKLTVSNQAGRICRGSRIGADRGSGLVPRLYYPSSFFGIILLFHGEGISYWHFGRRAQRSTSNSSEYWP